MKNLNFEIIVNCILYDCPCHNYILLTLRCLIPKQADVVDLISQNEGRQSNFRLRWILCWLFFFKRFLW